MESEKILDEYTQNLYQIRQHYRKLHYVNLQPISADDYYDSLLDRDEYKPPKDRTQKEATIDAGITISLRIKSFINKDAKKELYEKSQSY